MKDHNLAVRPVGVVLYFQADVLEKSGVPQRLKIAVPQFLFVVGIAGLGENAALQSFVANEAVAFEFNAIDDRGRLAGSCVWDAADLLRPNRDKNSQAQQGGQTHT